MKRIKTPSSAPIHLGDLDHRVTPAVINALLKPQRLRESFSFLTKPRRSFNSFIPVSPSLPGYYLIKNICLQAGNVHLKT
jgi:hypothetical protein